MYRWFKKSVQHQLIVFVLLAVLIPISLLGTISYFTANHLAKQRATESAQSSLDQLEKSLEFIVNDVDNMSVFLIGNEDVQQYLKTEKNTVQQRWNIYGFLSNLTYSKSYIANILIEPLNKNQNISTLSTLSSNTEYSVNHKQNVIKSFRYENDVITLHRPIRSTDDYQLIGYLNIYLDQQVMEKYIQAVDLEWGGTTYLLKDDILLAAGNRSNTDVHLKDLSQRLKANQNPLTTKMEGMENTIISSKVPEVDWALISVIPTKKFTAENRKFLQLTLLAIIIAILLVTALVLFFVRKVIGPLSKLTEVIQTSDPTAGLKLVSLHSSDEIGLLLDSYNKLNKRIYHLLDQIKRNEARKREIDLQALQAQINPHFLYNTLASIHWMALVNHDIKISRMVSALSNFLRYSLNKGNEYCTIKQELEHLDNYVRIQQLRYPNLFQLNIDIPKEVEEYYMLKLVLQPLIENSIIHGLLPNENKQGKIDITGCWEQDSLCIHVHDNGIGMSKEKLKELNEWFLIDEKLEEVVGTSYGLRNVNLRLSMHYGSTSRLTMNSEKNKGTTISFVVPLEKRFIK
ncbi:sensor histidine kinase [Gracilibacillus lacisalsi]|uniref:sensor histidine kinase n=1 Tax=Gracilibacillus lacisalsi TaxID=393087 RepID=UPI00037DAAED|nr:sensor histidine kinase [Gracilibacillus lacisalsi]